MSEETRMQILDAAEARFRIYGYGKTTMAEIASDIEMSTANLYRFFENKLDIGSAMALRCFDEREKVLTAVLDQPGLSAGQMLEQFVLTILDYNMNQFAREPKLSELVDVIITKRPDLVQYQVKSDKKLITAILEKGQLQGEFNAVDSERVSTAVLAAIAKFSSPFFVGMYPAEELRQQALGVVELILYGLAKRQ